MTTIIRTSTRKLAVAWWMLPARFHFVLFLLLDLPWNGAAAVPWQYSEVVRLRRETLSRLRGHG